tara:strand:+ start:2473 stop:3552 length:1080 start_codon:yes stop_codon:yes gene_type:complete
MQQQTERQKPMSRIRLNQEYRNKIGNRMRVHLEQENTQEKEKFFKERESFLDKQNATWDLAKQCVTRQYPKDDVKMAHYLQDKYPNVNTIAKDSCFHFGYMKKKDGVESTTDGEYMNDNRHRDQDDQDDKYVTKHFDFRLNGDIDGVDRQGEDYDSYNPQSKDFAYAYFRDELKAKENCNPDINIEMDNKPSNPHQTKFCDANDKALGFSGGKGNEISHARDWNANYELDLIGREYCRDRQIPVSKAEFQTFVIWQQAKGQMIMAHYKWIKSVLTQMKFVKDVIKGYKYLDEALEFAKESDLNLDEAEIIRCNSSGLMIYNPKNAAEMLKSMKNKNQTREQKIALRKAYNLQHGAPVFK